MAPERRERIFVVVIAAVVSAFLGTGTGVASHQLSASELVNRLGQVEAKVHQVEVQNARVETKLELILERVDDLKKKCDERERGGRR